MALSMVPDKYDKIAPTVLDLAALLLLSAPERAELDEQPHGALSLEEHCFYSGIVLFARQYTSFVAALEHADDVRRWSPDAFTPDHGPIRLVLTEVTR